MADALKVIIAAAGSSSRMGPEIEVNKPYIKLKGKPILTYSLGFFDAITWVDEVIIMAAPEEVEYCQQAIVKKYGYQKVTAVLPGGARRQDTIWQGLQYLSKRGSTYVAVHDGARPFLSYGVFYQLCLEAYHFGATVPGVKVKDTVKLVNEGNVVTKTPPREYLFAVQTPQVFHFERIYQAYERALHENFYGTDDAGLYERFIGPVRLVESERDNLKITTPLDLILAEQVVEKVNRGEW